MSAVWAGQAGRPPDACWASWSGFKALMTLEWRSLPWRLPGQFEWSWADGLKFWPPSVVQGLQHLTLDLNVNHVGLPAGRFRK